MIQRKRKTKRFYRLLLSYCLIVVLITVIVYTGIISRYLNSVQKNTETEYNRMAENAGNLLDERISELSALAARINGNKRLRNSVIQNSYFAQMEAIDELSNYNNLNSFLTDVLLFMFPEETENVLVLTSLNKYTLTSFFQTHQFDNWTPEEIEELYRSNQQLSSQLPIMKFVRERNSVSGAWDVDLCCLYILPIGFANPREIAAFRISEEKLISLVESATGGNRVVFSIQENNAVIYSSSSESTENAYEHTVPSSVVNWSYTVRFLDAPLMEAVGWVRMQMGLIMICLLTVSVLLAVFFTYINHLPLRMLADKLNSDRTGVDEIQILDEGMDDLLKTRDEMQLQLNKKDRALRAKRLTSLLLGNEDDMKLFFPDGLQNCCGVVLLIVDTVRLQKEKTSMMHMYTICESLLSTMEELAQEYGNGYASQVLEGSVCALLIDVKDADMLRQYANALQETVEKYYRLSCTIGLSSVSEGLADVHSRYLEANVAVRQRVSQGSNCIIQYTDICARQSNALMSLTETKKALLNQLRKGNTEQAVQIACDGLEAMREERASSEEMLLYAIGLINVIAFVNGEQNSHFTAHYRQTIQQLCMDYTLTFEEMRQCIANLIELVCNDINSQRAEGIDERINRIMQIIDQRYTDPTFCLNDIAADLGLSPSYTTSLFKTYTGESLMNYVDHRRMKNAVLLLETTRLPLREIITQVGYTDQTNFIRKFKNAHDGKTPQKYRDDIQQTTI